MCPASWTDKAACALSSCKEVCLNGSAASVVKAMDSSEGLSKRASDTKDAMAAEPENKYHGKPPLKQQGGLRSLTVAVTVPLILGLTIGFFFAPDKEWYASLKKPSWNPPGWIFGLVWSIVYPVMGLSSWLVWANGGWHRQAYPLGLYVLQLVLNLCWSVAFFGFQSPLLALVDIGFLAVVLIVCIQAFKPVNHVASNLMQVYLTWVLFAAALNATIWYSNLGHGGNVPMVDPVADSPPHVE